MLGKQRLVHETREQQGFVSGNARLTQGGEPPNLMNYYLGSISQQAELQVLYRCRTQNRVKDQT